MFPICRGCGSNQWRTVEGHVKKCAVTQPTVASRKVEPEEPHWRRSDPLLMNHTRAPETEAMYTLQVWPDPPNDEEPHTSRPDLQTHLKRMGGPGC